MLQPLHRCIGFQQPKLFIPKQIMFAQHDALLSSVSPYHVPGIYEPRRKHVNRAPTGAASPVTHAKPRMSAKVRDGLFIQLRRRIEIFNDSFSDWSMRSPGLGARLFNSTRFSVLNHYYHMMISLQAVPTRVIRYNYINFTSWVTRQTLFLNGVKKTILDLCFNAPWTSVPRIFIVKKSFEVRLK